MPSVAAEMAREIADHYWADAPYRLDRAGHQRDGSQELTAEEAARVRDNVVLVTVSALRCAYPGIDDAAYARACGAGLLEGTILHGRRIR